MPPDGKISKPKPLRDPGLYKIGIICAREEEINAVQSSFDHFFLEPDERPQTVQGDDNSYSFGTIYGHHVVLAGIGGTENVPATDVATNMARSFPHIQLCLVVGICGILPKKKESEMILGDVVMSKEVIYYTKGKRYPTGHQTEDRLAKAPKAITRGFAQLCTHKPWKAFRNKVHKHLRELMEDDSIKELRYEYPGRGTDLLYNVDYLHTHHDGNCAECRTGKFCQTAVDSSCHDLGCSEEQLVRRERISNNTVTSTSTSAMADRTASPDGNRLAISNLDASFLPQIYMGKMASGDLVLKDGNMREMFAKVNDVIAFEMAGAGVAYTFPTVVIKAGCDYADSHKRNHWQEWAAMTAASCAKAFLGHLQMGIATNVEYVGDDIGPTNSQDCLQFPDKTPDPIRNIPFDPIPGFIGRQDELVKLEQKLLDPGSRRIVSISGLGGIGKSRLALEFSSFIKLKHPHYSIFWVQASDQSTFEKDLLEIGKQLHIPGIGDGKSDVKTLVKQRLSSPSSDKWILILDDADNESLWGQRWDANKQQFSLVNSLPKTTNGSILVTTRTRQVASFLAAKEVIELAALSQDEAGELFKSNLEVPLSVAEQKLLVTLSKNLVCLPLAIIQAAAFINRTQVSVQEYLELLNQPEADVVKLFSKDIYDTSRYPSAINPIATTWFVSFEHVEKHQPFAIALLSFMACLDEKDIPSSLLPTAESTIDYVEAIAVLKGYSFITKQTSIYDLPIEEELYSMHRLVQLAVRNWLRINGKLSDQMKACTQRLAQVFPTRNDEHTNLWRLYLPHAQRICEGTIKIHFVERYNLLEKRSRSLLVDGKDDEAVTTHTIVVKWREENLGRSDEAKFYAYNNPGEALSLKGDWERAEMYVQQAVDGQKELCTPEELEMIISMANLASQFWKQGRWTKAEELTMQGVETKKRVLGVEHPDGRLCTAMVKGS